MRVPRENLIGEEGKGLKIALITLNTGRLTLPAACAGIAKQCLEIVRGWANERVQWGVPIWKHEAIAHRVADMAATTFAMDSVAKLASADGRPRRLRHPPRGRRRQGVEHRARLGDRRPDAADPRRPRLRDRELARRPRRDADPRRARDARLPHQPHLRGLERDDAPVHGARGGRQAPASRRRDDRPEERRRARSSRRCRRSSRYYACWYPPLWLRGLGNPVRYGDWGTLAPHLRFVERSARKLARESFHGMAVYQAKMERKQGFLFRCVDVVMELFAMSATISHARQMLDARHPEARARRRARRPLLPQRAPSGEAVLPATCGATTTPSRTVSPPT